MNKKRILVVGLIVLVIVIAILLIIFREKRNYIPKGIDKNIMVGEFMYYETNDVDNCGVKNSVNIVIEADKFEVTLNYACSESEKYSGTYEINKTKLKFEVTHYNGIDISDKNNRDFINNVMDKKFLNSKDSYINVINKERIEYSAFNGKVVTLNRFE